jgi:hypothetical protein
MKTNVGTLDRGARIVVLGSSRYSPDYSAPVLSTRCSALTPAQWFAEQQKKVDDLRREMIVSRLETRKQIEGVLTPEQRQQFRQFGPRWLGESDVE